MILDEVNWRTGAYLVIGDLLVDEYNLGNVTRISPEAPVPVLDFSGVSRAPGGAANVALNLRKLGHKVELTGVVGPDEAGQWLIDTLKLAGIGTDGIIIDENRPTTRKVRFSTRQQSLLRVDYEDAQVLGTETAAKLVSYIRQYLPKHPLDGVLISDYGAGIIPGADQTNVVSSLLSDLSDFPFIYGADTKKRSTDLPVFAKVDFIKPNLTELQQATGLRVHDRNSMRTAAQKYLELSGAKSILVTLSANGMYHWDGSREIHIPIVPTNVRDVTGAGDTVFAVVTHARSHGFDWSDAMRLANIAASIIVEKQGTNGIDKNELRRRVRTIERKQPEYFVAGPSEIHF